MKTKFFKLFLYVIAFQTITPITVKAQEFCDGPGWPSWQDPFWQDSEFQMYLEPQGSRLIPSPFHASGAYLNPNIEALSWPASKDYDQESGWVHISHDFGTPSTPVPNPQMNEKFYKDFLNGKNYYEIEILKKAFSYLEPTWQNSEEELKKNFEEELKKNFEEDFIHNFIEGQSIFFASW